MDQSFVTCCQILDHFRKKNHFRQQASYVRQSPIFHRGKNISNKHLFYKYTYCNVSSAKNKKGVKENNYKTQVH